MNSGGMSQPSVEDRPGILDDPIWDLYLPDEDSFTDWLVQQAMFWDESGDVDFNDDTVWTGPDHPRSDAVSDLAYGVRQDENWPAEFDHNVEILQAYLETHHIGEHGLHALALAYVEWAGIRARRRWNNR